MIDNKNFFGGVLHVFYIPELETLAETRAKLIQRRKDVAIQIKRNQRDLTNPGKFVPKYVLSVILCVYTYSKIICNNICNKYCVNFLM